MIIQTLFPSQLLILAYADPLSIIFVFILKVVMKGYPRIISYIDLSFTKKFCSLITSPIETFTFGRAPYKLPREFFAARIIHP